MKLQPGDLVKSYYYNVFAYPTPDYFLVVNRDRAVEVPIDITLIVIACHRLNDNFDLMLVLGVNAFGWVNQDHFGKVDA